jgi:hypothetical protein
MRGFRSRAEVGLAPSQLEGINVGNVVTPFR